MSDRGGLAAGQRRLGGRSRGQLPSRAGPPPVQPAAVRPEPGPGTVPSSIPKQSVMHAAVGVSVMDNVSVYKEPSEYGTYFSVCKHLQPKLEPNIRCSCICNAAAVVDFKMS